MVPSRVAGGMNHSLRSGMFSQGDERSNSQLNPNFDNSSNSIPGNACSNTGPPVLNGVANSGPSVGASSLVTDANSGLSGGPLLQRSVSNNTESYMRLPASPMSFSSNNISISGSSVVDGSSIGQPGPNQNQNPQQASNIRELLQVGHHWPTSRMGQVQLPGGPRVFSSLMQDPTAMSQLQKKPRLDIKQEDILQQQVLQQLLQRQDSMSFQNSNPQLQALIQQQRLRQQQQQQQLLQSMPPLQRAQLLQQQQQQQQLRQQLQQQGMQPGSSVKRPMMARMLSSTNAIPLSSETETSCEYVTSFRDLDNSIAYWKKFVAEYYSPRAKKRWCLSLYDNVGHHSLGVFPQAAMDAWQCDICGSKSGRGFEATVEVLPRLNEIKFGSGVIDELLFLDLPRECRFPSGMMTLEYAKAVQESIYEQLRVVREGQLRIIFSPDLKILSWEFCARRHEELLSRRLVAPQVNQLLQVAQKCQSTISESGPDGVSQNDLQANSVMVVTAGRQLAKSLELQSLNDLGFSKRYVRCLQIAEVVNSMKSLMDFCRDQKVGPIEGLKNFPRHNTVQHTVQPKIEMPENFQRHNTVQHAVQPKIEMPENFPRHNIVQHAVQPKIEMPEMEPVGGVQSMPNDCNTLNKLMALNPGANNQINNNQHMVGRGALSGSAQAALALTNYQNLLMRQNSINSTHNSVQQEASSSFSNSTQAPNLQNVQPGGGFSSSHVTQQQQQVFQRSLSGNGMLMQNQPQGSHASQLSQQQTIQQFLQDMNNNGGNGVQQQSVQSFRNSPSVATTPSANGQGNIGVHPPSRSNSFKSASNNEFSFSQKTSDLPQNLHLSDEMVQDIAHEPTENGFFNSDLDDSMNYMWK